MYYRNISEINSRFYRARNKIILTKTYPKDSFVKFVCFSFLDAISHNSSCNIPLKTGLRSTQILFPTRLTANWTAALWLGRFAWHTVATVYCSWDLLKKTWRRSKPVDWLHEARATRASKRKKREKSIKAVKRWIVIPCIYLMGKDDFWRMNSTAVSYLRGQQNFAVILWSTKLKWIIFINNILKTRLNYKDQFR